MSRLLLIVPFLAICAPLLADDDATQRRADVSEVAKRAVDLTNAFRQENHLQPVTSNDKLTKTAVEFAKFMARTGKYGHEADGRTPAQRVQANGYEYAIVLENIQMQFRSDGFATDQLARSAVEGWENSPPHRKNMLNPDVTETGVGFARSEDGHYYGVQLFGRPKSAAIKFSIANRSNAEVQYKLEHDTFKLPPRMTRTHTIPAPSNIEFVSPRKMRKTIEPTDGALYVVKQDRAGALAVTEATDEK